MPASAPDPALGDRTRATLADTEQAARYRWAASVCSGRRVLDVGCGPDGETVLLADCGAASVTAVVASDAAAQLARAALGEAVACEVSRPDALPFSDDAFDLVVAFDVLDGGDDPAPVLDELVRVLAPGGRLLAACSSAVSASVLDLIRPRWDGIEVLEQRTMVASVIGEPDAGEVSIGALPEPPSDAAFGTVLIDAGAAGDAGASVLAFGALAPVSDWLADAARAKETLAARTEERDELARRDQRGAAARRQLTDAEQRVARLAATEAERDDARRDLRDTRERLQQAEGALARTAAELAGLRASRIWRLTAPLRRLQRRRRAA